MTEKSLDPVNFDTEPSQPNNLFFSLQCPICGHKFQKPSKL